MQKFSKKQCVSFINKDIIQHIEIKAIKYHFNFIFISLILCVGCWVLLTFCSSLNCMNFVGVFCTNCASMHCQENRE